MPQSANKITLRPATLADAPLLEAWDKQPHVIDATGGDDEHGYDWRVEIARSVAWRDILIADIKGRAIGVLQIIDPFAEETHYWGAAAPNQRAIDIWLGDLDDTGRGYGTRMMELAFERCFENTDVTTILIDPLASNKRAITFYKRLGFKPLGVRMFDEDRCLVLLLTRKVWRQRLTNGTPS